MPQLITDSNKQGQQFTLNNDNTCIQKQSDQNSDLLNKKHVDDTKIPYYITLIGLIFHIYNSYVSPASNIIWFFHAIYTFILVIRFSTSKQSAFPQYKLPKNSSHLQSNISKQTLNTCKICKNIKPSRFYHCRKCNICVYRMNHHCLWLSNCIGQYNGKIYLHILLAFLFISGECILVYLSRFLVYLWATVMSQQNNNTETGFRSYLTIKILIFGVNSFVFYESFRMFRQYIDSINQNQTLIEMYKGVKGFQKKSALNKWQQIMGYQFYIWWILPTYAGINKCNIYEQVFIIHNKNRQFIDQKGTYQNQQNQQLKEKVNSLKVEQYDYADQYIYGPDDETKFNQLYIVQKQLTADRKKK